MPIYLQKSRQSSGGMQLNLGKNALARTEKERGGEREKPRLTLCFHLFVGDGGTEEKKRVQKKDADQIRMRRIQSHERDKFSGRTWDGRLGCGGRHRRPSGARVFVPLFRSQNKIKERKDKLIYMVIDITYIYRAHLFLSLRLVLFKWEVCYGGK